MAKRQKNCLKTRMKTITQYSIDILRKQSLTSKELSRRVSARLTQKSEQFIKLSNVQRRIYDSMLILRGIGFIKLKQKKVYLQEYSLRTKETKKQLIMKNIKQQRKRIMKLKKMKKELLKNRLNVINLIKKNQNLFQSQTKHTQRLPFRNVFMIKINQTQNKEDALFLENSISMRIQAQKKSVTVKDTERIWTNMDILNSFLQK